MFSSSCPSEAEGIILLSALKTIEMRAKAKAWSDTESEATDTNLRYGVPEQLPENYLGQLAQPFRSAIAS